MDVLRMFYNFFVCGYTEADLAFYSAQFVPIISEDPSTKVVNFCRTPQWYLDRVSICLLVVLKCIEYSR